MVTRVDLLPIQVFVAVADSNAEVPVYFKDGRWVVLYLRAMLFVGVRRGFLFEDLWRFQEGVRVAGQVVCLSVVLGYR